MVPEACATVMPAAFFHEDTGAVRFWVPTGEGTCIGASVRREVLHYRFGADLDGHDAVATYEAHRDEFAAAVLKRVTGGSREPVMLREADFGAH
ncbi:MAG TPA: DUF1488 family protein [Burkholderiaceae bacterium]|nr:DUF1488 family protein [Burkholderiaceae bacterium]